MSSTNTATLFDKWNAAFQTKNPQEVLKCYAETSILLPTLSNDVCDTPEKKINYFETFCAKGPNGKIDISHIREYGNITIHSGIYTFTFSDGSSATARFTFVYDNELIIEHHSSLLPEND